MLSMPWNEHEPEPSRRQWQCMMGCRCLSVYLAPSLQNRSCSASWPLGLSLQSPRNNNQRWVYIIYLLIYRLYLYVLCKYLKPNSTQCHKNDVSIARGNTWYGFKYDRWDDLPCFVNWSERNWITLKLEWGREREGHAGVILLEQDAEKSNLLWSDSLKAKNKLTGGSLGSLAACSQYFIINDNKKKKGGRQGIWACVPFLQPLPPNTQSQLWSSQQHKLQDSIKGTSGRKEMQGRMKNGLALVLVSSPLHAWIIEPLCGIPSDLLEPLPQATRPPTDAPQASLDEQQWKRRPRRAAPGRPS